MAYSIYQIKMTLKDIEPLIWRRFQINGNINLFQLHKIIQTIMGWENAHLHQFLIHDKKYSHHGYEPEEFRKETLNEGKFKLNGLITKENTSFIYEYDFGDDWKHELVVENILKDQEQLPHPICLAGENACPPEDCGGPWGYQDFIEAFQDSKHERHKECREWVGNDFDPEALDADRINQHLKRRKVKTALQK